MGRIANFLSDLCVSALATQVERSGPLAIDALTFNASLKYLIVQDLRITVEITSETTFEVYEVQHGIAVHDGPAISEARLSDFFLGAARVRKQHETVLALRDFGNPAWLLVSAYYCAFFSCIELAKALGRISFSVDEADIFDLRIKATGPAHTQFFSKGHSNFVGVERAGRLLFTAVGTQPHAAAWENARQVVAKAFRGKNWTDANNFKAILENPECSPSRIRNTWNYKRADFFGPAGDRQAHEFKKLVGNMSGVLGWIDRRAENPGTLDPCVIAVMAETLSTAVSDASRRARGIVQQVAQE